MATIGSMAVNLVATTDKFISGLNQAQTGLGRFVKKISTVQNAVIGLGVAGFGAMVKGALDAGSALFDLAQKLNISTEALTGLDYAVTAVGGSTDAMHGALTKLTRRLGEASAGVASAQQAFSRLGMDFREIMGIPIEQQFLAIVDAINKIPGAEDRAAAAAAVFGRSAGELNNIISAGTDELIRLGNEAAQVGAVIGTDQAAALDNAADSVTRLTASWAGLKLQMVSVAAPVISSVMDAVTEATKAIRGLWYGVQSLLVGSWELLVTTIKKGMDLINVALPQSMEINTGALNSYIEEFRNAGKEIQSNMNIMRSDSTAGPLARPGGGQPPEQKQIEKNTRDTAGESKRQTALLQKIAGQPPLTIHTAAIR